MKAGKIFILTAVTLLVLCLSGLPVLAQDKSADNMQIVLAKLKADKKLLVAENMGLTDSESKAFWPVYESYQKDLLAQRARLGDMIEGYAKNYDSMTDDAARKLTDTFLSIKADQVKLMSSYAPRFREVLPEAKVARYIQIENKIDAILNYALADAVPLVK